MTRDRLDEGIGQVRERTYVEVDHGALPSAVERAEGADQPKSGIVDDDVRLEPLRLQRLADALDRIRLFEIGRQHGRPRASAGGDGVGERGQFALAPRHENELMAVFGKDLRQRRTDAGGCPGDQRDRTHQLFPSPRLPVTRCRSSIRSREEMPKRSAARQIRLSSNSVMRLSA